MSRNVGHVSLTYKAIGDMLGVPRGHRIERIFDDPDNIRETVIIRITGHQMPVVPEGGAIPSVSMPSSKTGKLGFKPE